MKPMSDEEIRHFLTNGTRTAKLATVRSDGRPHVTPIWFVLDGEDLLFTTWHQSVKGMNLKRDGRVTLCVDDERPPFAFVIVEGKVTIEERSPNLQRWATRIAARYMGAEEAEAFGKRNSVPGEWLVRVHVHKTIAQKEVAGWD